MGTCHGVGCTWWDASWISTAPNVPQCFCQCSQSNSKAMDNRKVAEDAGATPSSGNGQPFRAIWNIWTCPGKKCFPCPVQDCPLWLATWPKPRSAQLAEVAVGVGAGLGRPGGYLSCRGSCLPPGCWSVQKGNVM